MTSTKPPLPAVSGWFEMDFQHPHLLGGRCAKCGTYSFPKETLFCKNPSCDGDEFQEVKLSPHGRIWSYTNSCYKPPPPFVAHEPYHPLALAAVELEDEKLVIMGQLATGVTVNDVQIGQGVELILETLFEDEQHRYVVWKWKPTGA